MVRITEAGQRELLATAVEDIRKGTGYRCVIENDGQPVGMITLSAIVRGAAQSASVGYWLAESVNGRRSGCSNATASNGSASRGRF